MCPLSCIIMSNDFIPPLLLILLFLLILLPTYVLFPKTKYNSHIVLSYSSRVFMVDEAIVDIYSLALAIAVTH